MRRRILRIKLQDCPIRVLGVGEPTELAIGFARVESPLSRNPGLRTLGRGQKMVQGIGGAASSGSRLPRSHAGRNPVGVGSGDQGGKLLGAAEITLRERLLCLLQCRNRRWRCGTAAQHQPGRSKKQRGDLKMRVPRHDPEARYTNGFHGDIIGHSFDLESEFVLSRRIDFGIQRGLGGV